MSWSYRSVSDLNDAIVNWMSHLPEFDLIVGIPRSGMLAASLLALHRNALVTDLEGLLTGRALHTGTTKPLSSRGARVLVLDDSVCSGAEMMMAKALIVDTIPMSARSFSYGSVYVAPRAEIVVDYYAEFVPTPRFFEWNLMHYEELLARSCMDIDGVLCQDPTDEENDGDGPNYQRFVSDAFPLYLPSCRVGWLVTSRLERYREQTEAWLREHCVQYGELVMMDYPDADSRRRDNAYAEFKADHYHRMDADLFIESEVQTAVEIRRRAGKQVFCMETKELL